MSLDPAPLKGETYTVLTARRHGTTILGRSSPGYIHARELNGKLYASVDPGFNGLTIAIRLDATHIPPSTASS